MRQKNDYFTITLGGLKLLFIIWSIIFLVYTRLNDIYFSLGIITALIGWLMVSDNKLWKNRYKSIVTSGEKHNIKFSHSIISLTCETNETEISESKIYIRAIIIGLSGLLISILFLLLSIEPLMNKIQLYPIVGVTISIISILFNLFRFIWFHRFKNSIRILLDLDKSVKSISEYKYKITDKPKII